MKYTHVAAESKVVSPQSSMAQNQIEPAIEIRRSSTNSNFLVECHAVSLAKGQMGHCTAFTATFPHSKVTVGWHEFPVAANEAAPELFPGKSARRAATNSP